MADGHFSFCKSCVKQRVTEHRKRNVERIRAYDVERFRNSPERRRMHDEYGETYRQRHPQRAGAQGKVHYAVRTGKLTKLPCEMCGNPKSEAHHDDYSKPLDVRWLCKLCHEAFHHQPEKKTA
jgi:hypothetical protein